MKYIILISTLGLLFSCSRTYSDTSRQSKIDNKEILADNFQGSPQEELAYMLRKESGVIVSERYGRFAVRIRGLSNSIKNPSPPLYVLNGITLGHDFDVAAESIMGSDIKSIKVLKDQQASFYGVQGSGGVIEIKTN